MHESSAIFKIIHETYSRSDNELSIKSLCNIAGVSRSGYYNWIKSAEIREEREIKDQADFALILEAYNHRGYSKGAKSIYMHLIHQDPPIVMNLKKIRRLMRKYNLFCPIRKANPYRRMARALRSDIAAANLVNREFEQHGPRSILLTDITYIPYNSTFLYLSTVIDGYTKQILSHVMSDSLEMDIVLETINQLVTNHGVSLHAETLIHSDRGCHYTNKRFIEILKSYELRQSMSRLGNCWDNAPQESFFGHMKDSIVVYDCTTFSQVKDRIDDYIDYYNNERYQWDLAKLSPNEFYEYITTGVYPLKIKNPPALPEV